MKVKLKQFRVAAGMTQAKVALAAGVTQPTYQRWETGAVAVPTAKLKLLAKLWGTTEAAILAKHGPIESSLYDDDADDEVSYYGEVSFHFAGSGAPLLLTISEKAFYSLYKDAQGDSNFLNLQSLANQSVIVRKKAISDLYFSSEAHDDYGPEHGAYSNHANIQIPDNRDWDIIESLSDGGVNIYDFAPEDVERVKKMVMITDDQYTKLVAEGRIQPECLEHEKNKNQAETDFIFSLANDIIYQLSNGIRRTVPCFNNKKIFHAFYDLIDYDGGISADDMILLEVEGRHRVIFINKSAIDYITIPSHRLDDGRVEADAESIDE